MHMLLHHPILANDHKFTYGPQSFTFEVKLSLIFPRWNFLSVFLAFLIYRIFQIWGAFYL